MKNLIFTLLLFAGLSLSAQTGNKNFIDQNYIEVTGKAEMEISPDEIYLRIRINEKDFKGKTLSEIESLMIGKLKETGLDPAKDLTISDLASNLSYYWLFKTDPRLSKEYMLRVRDVKLLAKVFQELQKLDIANVTVTESKNSRILEHRKEVKVAAVLAAQEKAKSLAQALNQDIGRAIYIQEQESNNINQRFSNASLSNVAIRGYSPNSITQTGNNEVDIEFEKIKLSYEILVRFELK